MIADLEKNYQTSTESWPIAFNYFSLTWTLTQPPYNEWDQEINMAQRLTKPQTLSVFFQVSH